MKIPFLTKKIEAIIVKLLILVCDTDLCNKNISKIRNVTFIFQNVQKKFQTKKKFNSHGFGRISKLIWNKMG